MRARATTPGATFTQRIDRLLLGRTYFIGRAYARTVRPLLSSLSHTTDDTDTVGHPVTTRLLEAIQKLLPDS